MPPDAQVGLRPGRPSVRLELEHFPLQPQQQAQAQAQEQQQQQHGGGKAALPVVHNYGHGGAGLTLAWGCAADASTLVRQALQEQ